MRLVDLFCGTGGFSRGAQRAGFEVPLAVDNDPNLTFSHKHNFPHTKLLREDISTLSGERIRAEATGRIDGIIGGPPCQGFSSIGRRDPSDERRRLLHHFFRLVSEVEPSFFVMENVRGLLDQGSRSELDEGIAQVDRYDVLDPLVLDAADFGAATRRKRIFVLGTHKDKASPISVHLIEEAKRPAASVKQAISDLEDATYIQDDERGYDLWRTKSKGRPSAYAAALRAVDGRTTGLRPTRHSKEVQRRFSTVSPGEVDPVGRHPRLDWHSQCPTLRAGTGADRGSYQSVRPIHPDENRVITVREAARLQGFPDDHYFHPTVWHSFRMIGNSVAPHVAQAILKVVAAALRGGIQAPQEIQAAELHG